MKSNNIAIFLAAYLLFIAAHAGLSGASVAAMPSVDEPEHPAPLYQLEPVSVSRTICSEDKKNVELAVCDYQLLTLSVVNLDALSPAEAETAARNVETFNERMASVMEAFEDHGREVSSEAQDIYSHFGYLIAPYYDHVETTGTILGDVVSLRAGQENWLGGAHPGSFEYGYLFDLETGQFIPDPSQLADDPALFHSGTAELLIEKAENERDLAWGYWDDYQEIIRTGTGGVTVFDEEGMTVVYAPYELGCYAIGEIELRLDWEEMSDLLGPGGLTKLGVELPEAAE